MSASATPQAHALMVRTAKGNAELASESHRLGPRLRTVLRMVDGQLTFAELSARAAAFGNAPAIVTHLLSEGHIQAKDAAPRKARPLAAQSADAAHLVTELSRSGNLVTLQGDALAGMRETEAINPARHFMRETIGRLLGAGAVGVLDAIDHVPTRAALLAELDTCQQIVRDLKGGEEADRFRVSVLALLPASGAVRQP